MIYQTPTTTFINHTFILFILVFLDILIAHSQEGVLRGPVASAFLSFGAHEQNEILQQELFLLLQVVHIQTSYKKLINEGNQFGVDCELRLVVADGMQLVRLPK